MSVTLWLPSLLVREEYNAVASFNATLYFASLSTLSLFVFDCGQFACAGVSRGFDLVGGGLEASLSFVNLRIFEP